MQSEDNHVVCPRCGQDWQVWYRNCEDGTRFLLCPECDAVWLADDDRFARPKLSLAHLFGSEDPRRDKLIERCDPS
jgi:uncharacterized C2H2 Zn-finger protein